MHNHFPAFEGRPENRKMPMLWLALALPVLPAALGAQSYTFALNPKDGQTDIVRLSTSLTITPGLDPPVTQEADWLVESTAKKYINGLAITMKPLSYSMRYNGAPLGTAGAEALEGNAFTFLVDTQGELREIQGLDHFLAALQGTVSEQQPDPMAPELTRILGTALIQIWESKTGALFGRTFEIGEAWIGSDVAELPVLGKVPYASGYLFDEVIPCEAGECVRIVLSFYPDERAAYRAFGPKLGAEFEIPAARPVPGVVELTSGIEASGDGEWIVNPLTGDTVEMRITKKFRYQANYLGKAEVPFKLIESVTVKLEKSTIPEAK